MRGCLGQPAVEVGGRDVDAVEQRAALEMQRQRDDGDRACRRQLRRKVGGRVGDDRDPHGVVGSSGLMSLCRLLWRCGKKRSSTGLNATSTSRTRAAAVMAIAYRPKPTAMPKEATTQIVAAVVRPLTSSP